jgi:hypothetical protein
MSGDLKLVWEHGYSIAELWGAGKSVSRGTSAIPSAHPIAWGILSIAEYQINRSAGHRHLRERLSRGDWIAIGCAEHNADAKLMKVPPLANALFGKKRSAIGDGITNYINVRIVASELFNEMIGDTPSSGLNY